MVHRRWELLVWELSGPESTWQQQLERHLASEPVFAARSEQVRDSFGGYALPLAALRLKQGFGRLIRRSSDRGAVVILDNRISSRDYGKSFLEVLPRAAMFTGDIARVGERIEEWLGSVRAPS